MVGLLFVACETSPSDLANTATPWPTLAPIGTREGTQPSLPAAGDVTLIDRIRTEIQTGARAVFPLQGKADDIVRVEVVVLKGDVDPTLQINDPEGQRLASADFANTGGPEVIGEFQFPYDGAFELEVGSKALGGTVGISLYTLAQSAAQSPSSINLAGPKITRTLSYPASFQSHHLSLEKGKRVNIAANAESGSLHLDLELIGPDQMKLVVPVKRSDSGASIVNFLPEQSGAFTVIANNTGESTGSYSVSASLATPGAPASVGSRATIEIGEEPESSIWLTLDGIAQDGFMLDVRPLDPGLDITAAVFDPSGHKLTYVNQANIGGSESMDLVQFPFDGTYQLELSTVAGQGQIQYLIRPVRLVDAKIGGKIYVGGRAETGEIFGAGTVIVYTFEANEGDLIGVDAHATGDAGLDLGFDLFDPNGDKLVTRDDDIGKNPVLDRIELPVRGRYVLALWNYQGTTGTYEVYITKPENTSTSPAN